MGPSAILGVLAASTTMSAAAVSVTNSGFQLLS